MKRNLLHTSTLLAGLATLVVSLALPMPASAAGTYYRWRDEQGKLVVSDRTPEDDNVTYEVISQSSSLIRRVAPGEGAVPLETDPRPGNEFEQVDTREEELSVVKKNPERCSRARANLETLDTAARIRIRDEDTGQLRYLTQEDMDTQREKASDIVRVHCE